MCAGTIGRRMRLANEVIICEVRLGDEISDVRVPIFRPRQVGQSAGNNSK